MTRRSFIKWIVSLLVMVVAGVSFWVGTVRQASRKAEMSSDDQGANSGQGADSGGNGAGSNPNTDGANGVDSANNGQDASSVQGADRGANAGEEAPLLAYWILSDLHVNADDEYPSKHLNEALSDLRDMKSRNDLIVFTGDLTDTGRDRDYKELKKILNSYKLPPYYANMGNHDYYNIWMGADGQWHQDSVPNGKTDKESREVFMKFFGIEKPYGEAWSHNHHFILLSQEAYVQERPEVGEGAWYSDEQMAWFKQRMADKTDGRPVFVMIHQPLPPVGTDGGSHQLIRAKEFRDILKPYSNVIVFCGHRHQDFDGKFNHHEKETFDLFHNSSVGRVLNSGFREADKTKSQGIYVQVYQNKVVIRGREFSKRAWIDKASWTVELT